MANSVLKSTFKPICRLLSDKTMVKIQYRHHIGRDLNLSRPKTFNEKIQWLKLYDRRPEYTNYADKYAVRKHIAEIIGEEYLIPLLGVYDNVEDIDWPALPDQFVLKCTHGSSFNIICTDKTKLDIEASKKKLNKWMKQNFFWYGREWVYKDIKPRIICEKYMSDETGTDLKDYKIFCFHGEPKFIQVHCNRFANHKQSLYDTQWNFINASIGYPADPKDEMKKPEKLGEMLELSRVLAKKFYHIRIDFYYSGGRVYFGEMTFYDTSGYGKVQPEEFDELVGTWLQVP